MTHHHNHEDHSDMNHSQHDGMDHHMHGSDFYKKFIISLFLTVPLVVLSPTIQDIFGYELSFTGSNWLELLLASIL